MTEREMLSCPFCGDNPSYEVMDRMIVIGCEPCGYQRAFPGLLQAEVSAVRVSEREFYHADATDKAVEGWNQRLAPAQPVAAEPAYIAIEGAVFHEDGVSLIRRGYEDGYISRHPGAERVYRLAPTPA